MTLDTNVPLTFRCFIHSTAPFERKKKVYIQMLSLSLMIRKFDAVKFRIAFTCNQRKKSIHFQYEGSSTVQTKRNPKAR